DGVIKWWDAESGRMSSSAAEHSGMVTSFLYWAEAKLLLSASNDGTVLAWTTGATVCDKIELGRPVFSMAMNHRRHQLVCGFKSRLTVYSLDEKRVCGHIIKTSESNSDHRHKDIVSCIVCHDTQVYTGGYDKRFMVFDTSSYPNASGLTAVQCNSSAHEAGITTLLLLKQRENTRLLTGSFDKTVCVWSQDGQLIQRLSFSGVITGLCYASCVGLVWVACGSPAATILDPKSGEIASDFVDTFQNKETGHKLEKLLYLPETNSVIGTAGQSHVMIWKWKRNKSSTVLQNGQPVECMAYRGISKVMYYNAIVLYFCVSKEPFSVFERAKQSKGQSLTLKAKRTTNTGEKKLREWTSLRRRKSSNDARAEDQGNKAASLTRSVFIEELDLLAVSCENGHVYLWGFDDGLSSIMKMMPPQSNVSPDARKARLDFCLFPALTPTCLAPTTIYHGISGIADSTAILLKGKPFSHRASQLTIEVSGISTYWRSFKVIF
ncbi:CWF17 factor, partial [Amia calva]|nr:CWF17 factor [Amia calva]